MSTPIIASCTMLMLAASISSFAQPVSPTPAEDPALNPRPTIKVESLSPAGHCDNQQVSFFAPWADHYEIMKRRCDTAWVHDSRNINTGWASQALKPGVTGMIYKQLDEHGDYQFMVRAYKGARYRESDTITVRACVPNLK